MSKNKQQTTETAIEENVIEETSEAENQDISESHEVLEPEITFEELKEHLDKANAKAIENWDKAIRAQAEMENLKRRTQKDLEDAHKYALTGFAKEMITVLDSLTLGLQAASGDSEEVQKFREGSELTIKQLESAFARYNIVEINPVGENFNAEFHQAMLMQEVENTLPNTVINVFQKGYTLNGRLLRPAMVVVAKAKENASQA
jgi:molecular chaperone GrpE